MRLDRPEKSDTKSDSLDVVVFCSENKVWKIGIRKMLYGLRVSGSREKDVTYSFDYCCGEEFSTLYLVLNLIEVIFEKLDESISAFEVCNLLPRQTFKPINKDPAFARLQELAGVEPTKFWVCQICGRANYHEGDACSSCKRRAASTSLPKM